MIISFHQIHMVTDTDIVMVTETVMDITNQLNEKKQSCR